MSLRQGIARAAIFLSILYWAIVAKMAVLRAIYGYVDPNGPMAFLVSAGVVYAVFFGFFWTVIGFLGPGPC
jgi:hypothetical protein